MTPTSRLRPILMALRSFSVAAFLTLTLASASQAADHRMHVTEVNPSAQEPGSAFVELQDAGGESFPSPAYTLASLDANDSLIGQQTFNPPYGFAASTEPYLVGGAAVTPRDAALTIPLTGARKVCFYRGVGTAEPIHCLTFGPVPDRQSAQLTSTESVVFACPTPDAPNRQTAGACDPGATAPAPMPAGPSTPGPAPDTRAPGLSVSARDSQPVGRLKLVATPDERATIVVTGSIRLGGRTIKLVKATRQAGAGSRITIRVKLTATALRTVRRALTRGRILTAMLATTARDEAGNRSRLTRSVKLKR